MELINSKKRVTITLDLDLEEVNTILGVFANADGLTDPERKVHQELHDARAYVMQVENV